MNRNSAWWTGCAGFFRAPTLAKVLLLAEAIVLQRPLCKAGTGVAVQVMRTQETGGKVIFLDGSGAWGNPTPGNVAYGASKRAITQLQACPAP